jgi:hypothetical protein
MSSSLLVRGLKREAKSSEEFRSEAAASGNKQRREKGNSVLSVKEYLFNAPRCTNFM